MGAQRATGRMSPERAHFDGPLSLDQKIVRTHNNLVAFIGVVLSSGSA